MQNKILDNILFEKNDIDSPFIISTVENSLNGSDDGELFIEVVKNENLSNIVNITDDISLLSLSSIPSLSIKDAIVIISLIEYILSNVLS